LQVVLVEEPLHLDVCLVQALLDVGVELGELEGDHLSVRVLADEGEVDDANRVVVDEVGERGPISPRNLLPGNATIA
jgi:hypothetical protein